MPLPLADLRRSYYRSRSGAVVVVPLLLEREMLPRVRRVIEYIESLLGRPRSAFDPDVPARLVGDERLGRCLTAAVLAAYEYRGRTLADVLSPERQSALALRRVVSPADLRLALYDYVNERFHGFLPPEQRSTALAEFAAGLGLDPNQLEELLYLDAEEQALLVRAGPPPTAEEVQRRYNRWAVETLLLHASQIEFTFEQPNGLAIKQVYFLAKWHGLICDAFRVGDRVTVLVQGPFEVFGPRTRHGPALARFALRLLAGPQAAREHPPDAVATVHLNGRTYEFHLDVQVRRALRGAEEAAEAAVPYDSTYDSTIEAEFSRAFAGLARRGQSDGWTLVREPDPIISGELVFIPDFALERAGRRVYLEIIGFWTPQYKERKRAKLLLLSQQEPELELALAIDEALAVEFADLPYPIVPFRRRLAATAVLRLLREHFDRPHERLAAARARFAELRARVAQGGRISEAEATALLGLVAATELRELQAELEQEDIRLVPGAGLVSTAYLARFAEAVAQVLEGRPEGVTLSELRAALPGEFGIQDSELEALLAACPQFGVSYASLFDAVVRPADAPSPALPPLLALPARGGKRKVVPRGRAQPPGPPLHFAGDIQQA
jgi:predicted nuclease of restriction endonuclease-like RecB superfamily